MPSTGGEIRGLASFIEDDETMMEVVVW